MHYGVYTDLIISDNFRVFEFTSVGKYGFIPKKIIFSPTEIPDVYNLSFGDIDEKGGLNDYSISDNGDRNKILATIAKVVEQYTSKFPGRWIFFRGSTTERTRLYRMAVGINLDELSKKFEIYGELDNNLIFIPFQKNMTLSAFLIKRKTS